MANKNIRGITIEIGGDTTKLGKALTEVNSKTKNLQKELKGVETLLKMDPSNVTLLAQKQDILKESISNTSEKLKTLKEAQAQVLEQFKKGDVTSEQYRDFQREIANTERKLNDLTDELKEFGSVGAQQIAQVGGHIQDLGGKVESVGKSFSIVSAGTGALLAGSVASFVELDKGYDTIITKTGATGEALEELNTVADKIFSEMPTDMDNVGVAVGEINTRFGYTGDLLESLSTKFIKFAEINEVDLNNSIGTVDKILEQFNLDASEAGNILDLITLKAQQTGISADTLMSSIQDNGATFKDMNIGVNEALGLLAQFEANGVNVETALKGLKKATTEYADAGLSMDEALGATIESIKNAGSETEALAIAQEIFGTKGANEMSKAIREGRINIDDLKTSIEDYSGVVDSTFEGTLDPIDDSKVAMNNLKLAGSELAGVLQSTFAPILTSIVGKLKDLVQWFSNLSPTVQKTIVVVLSVATVLGPLLIIIGKLITSVGAILSIAPKLVGAFNLVKTAFTTLGSALMANPIGLVITAVTLLITTFALLWKNCEGFRDFWINLWEKLKEAVGIAIEFVVNLFNNIFNFFKENWQGILLFIINPFAGAFKLIYDNCEGFRDFIDNKVIKPVAKFFTDLWDGMKSGALNAWEGIKEIFSNVAKFFGDIFSNAWQKVKDVFSTGGKIFSGIKDGIVSAFTSVVNGLIKGINKVISVPFDFINGALNKIRNIEFLKISPFKNLWSQDPITVPQIPQLWRGGILRKGQTGYLEGDGAEAVVPLEQETGWINRIAQKMNDIQDRNPGRSNVALMSKMDELIRTVKNSNSKIVLDSGVLVGETINQIDAQLGYTYSLKERGV